MFACPTLEKVLDGLSAVDRGAIPDHQQLARNLAIEVIRYGTPPHTDFYRDCLLIEVGQLDLPPAQYAVTASTDQQLSAQIPGHCRDNIGMLRKSAQVFQ